MQESERTVQPSTAGPWERSNGLVTPLAAVTKHKKQLKDGEVSFGSELVLNDTVRYGLKSGWQGLEASDHVFPDRKQRVARKQGSLCYKTSHPTPSYSLPPWKLHSLNGLQSFKAAPD